MVNASLAAFPSRMWATPAIRLSENVGICADFALLPTSKSLNSLCSYRPKIVGQFHLQRILEKTASPDLWFLGARSPA